MGAKKEGVPYRRVGIKKAVYPTMSGSEKRFGARIAPKRNSERRYGVRVTPEKEIPAEDNAPVYTRALFLPMNVGCGLR